MAVFFRCSVLASRWTCRSSGRESGRSEVVGTTKEGNDAGIPQAAHAEAGSSPGYPSPFSLPKISMALDDCLSVGIRDGMRAVTPRMPVSVGVSKRLAVPHASASDQNCAPALTTATCASIPLSSRCSRRSGSSDATLLLDRNQPRDEEVGPADVKAADPFPACLFLGPFGHVADAGQRLNEDRAGSLGGDSEGALQGAAQRLLPPDGFEIHHAIQVGDVMGQLCDRVGQQCSRDIRLDTMTGQTRGVRWT